MGIFVVFEGVEGSGKTTQTDALVRRASSAGLSVTSAREPGGTDTAEGIRQLLRRDDGIEPLAEVFLFSAARASLVASVVRPSLQRGDMVVCDRYIYSTLAYQGCGRGIDLETIRQVNSIATGGLAPDLVVLLDLPPERGLDRKPQPDVDAQLSLTGLGEAEPLDRIEREGGGFHRRVREGYLELARGEPERWLVLDASLPAGELSEAVWGRVSELV